MPSLSFSVPPRKAATEGLDANSGDGPDDGSQLLLEADTADVARQRATVMEEALRTVNQLSSVGGLLGSLGCLGLVCLLGRLGLGRSPLLEPTSAIALDR